MVLNETIMAVMITGIAVGLITVPGLATSMSSIILNQSSFCNDTPFDGKCICPMDRQKVIRGLWEWHCVEKTVIPEGVVMPIDSLAEAEVFASEQLNNINCSGGSYYLDAYTLGVGVVQDQYRIECLLVEEYNVDGTPKSGRGLWSVWFYANDGFVRERLCAVDLFGEQCPENISLRDRS